MPAKEVIDLPPLRVGRDRVGRVAKWFYEIGVDGFKYPG